MKKNKKGFTLVEIMVVLLLIGIIILIAIPSINAVRRSIKERELSTKKDVLISAAETYAENNQSLFPKEGGIIQIPVRTLVYYGYVNSDDARKNCNETIGCVMNPVDDSSMNDDIITIKKVKSVTQATWDTVDAYLVTFKANGSTSVGGVTNQVSIGCDTFTNVTCTIKVPTIERDGFEKLGFNTNANASTSSVSVGSRLEVNSSNSGTNYYAITKKDVTVTFYPNNGTFTNGESSIAKSCTIRNTATNCSVASQEPSVSRIGYNKKTGWYSTSTSTTTVDISKVANSTSAYAQWNANTYTVKYDKNNTKATGTTADSSHVYDTAKNLTENGYSLTGYRYNGWNTRADGKGTSYANKQSVTNLTSTNGGTVTLYAQWSTNTYPVTFDVNGGNAWTSSTCGSGYTFTSSGAKCTKSVTYDSTYGSMPTPTRAGYSFAGWYTLASGGTKIETGTSVSITSAQTLYAHWTAITPTVTFDVNGGNAWTSTTCASPYTFTSSGSKCTKSVTYASTYGSMPTPTRAGHSFEGWYTSASGGTKIGTSSAVSITSAQTLYAHWKVLCDTNYTYVDNKCVADPTSYTCKKLASGSESTDTYSCTSSNYSDPLTFCANKGYTSQTNNCKKAALYSGKCWVCEKGGGPTCGYATVTTTTKYCSLWCPNDATCTGTLEATGTYKYSGDITCSKMVYSCSDGTGCDTSYCCKSDQSSCTGDWFISDAVCPGSHGVYNSTSKKCEYTP